MLGIAENFGTITLSNVKFIPNASAAGWNDAELNRTPAFLRPSPPYSYVTCVGSSLILNNCSISSSANMDVPAIILEANSTIAHLEFNGFTVQDGSTSFEATQLLNLEQGSIGQLVLNSLSTSGVAALVSPSKFLAIASVSGAGVLATEWKFPDAVMANQVPYLSASTGSPAIKIAGVVEPYP